MRAIKKDDQMSSAERRYCTTKTIKIQQETSQTGRFIMGRITGLEPATFGTTNQRSNQLSYIRHTVGHTTIILQNFGGADRTRTDDPLHAMQVLYQLSYNPMQSAILHTLCKKVNLKSRQSDIFYITL